MKSNQSSVRTSWVFSGQAAEASFNDDDKEVQSILSKKDAATDQPHGIVWTSCDWYLLFTLLPVVTQCEISTMILVEEYNLEKVMNSMSLKKLFL